MNPWCKSPNFSLHSSVPEAEWCTLYDHIVLPPIFLFSLYFYFFMSFLAKLGIFQFSTKLLNLDFCAYLQKFFISELLVYHFIFFYRIVISNKLFLVDKKCRKFILKIGIFSSLLSNMKFDFEINLYMQFVHHAQDIPNGTNPSNWSLRALAPLNWCSVKKIH